MHSARSASEAAFGDDEGALPIIAAVEHDEQAAGLDAAETACRPRALGEAHPQHVHRRAEILDFEAGEVAHRRVAAIGADDEIGAHVERAVGHFGLDARYRSRCPRQVVDLGLHRSLKLG